MLHKVIFKVLGGVVQNHLADGTRQSFDKSGLSISRKLVGKVFLEDCAFELLDIFWLLSVPFSILIASCIAKITSCILGLETPCNSTHWIATSAILHMDSILTFPIRKGSTTLITSPLRIKDLAYIIKRLIYWYFAQQLIVQWQNSGIDFLYMF